MKCRSYCEINEHDRIAGVPVGTPGTISRQLLERVRDPAWISSDIEPHRFQNSSNHIANVSIHDVMAGVRDSLAPLRDISRSKLLPVASENIHTSFALVDFLAVMKSQ